MDQQAQKSSSSALTGFDAGAAGADLLGGQRQLLKTLRDHGYCTYGHYPWDYWEKRALLRGVPRDLAGLGRAVMREADQHCWSERLQSLCGWRDAGRRMIALALRAPETARLRWEWLMETDGLRLDPESFEWIGEDDPSWPQRRRRWMQERRAAAAAEARS
jgi:hypothetical protein